MKKVRWGVIGAGGIADRRTIPGIIKANNAELVAVMEVTKETAEKIRDKYNAIYSYDNEDDLLANSSVDAVYISSPVSFHKEQALKAAKAKKHILLEKPMALTAEDSQEIVEVCQKNGVLLAVGFMMRFHSIHQKIKKLIQDGSLGQIVFCRAQLTCWYPEIEGAWRQKKATSGGGALMDLGVHCIDLLQYLLNSKTSRIASFSGTKVFNYEIEDSSSTMLEMENGTHCFIDAYFNIPDEAAKCRLEIYGTKGSALAENTISQVDNGTLELCLTENSGQYDAMQQRSNMQTTKIFGENGNLYSKEIEAFSNSVLNGCPVEVPGDDGVYVQKIVEAAYSSNKNRVIIKL
ncbi:MAG: Gfo/Idh/MocA family oxidoreductase [Clostridia bacterium]|nr:Gfo/Idh/MocA family oxidoreductase [Clostridia bacterium]